MALFQKSVLNKYLKTLDDKKVNEAYQKFTAFFHNPTIIQNIRDDKEEQFQYGFLQKLFDEVLDYTINPNIDFNLSTEFKNLRGAKKADGAILKGGKAIGVIELKSTKTKELDKITDQAFGYKNNHPTCVYVVTSNFEKLRFYINDAVDYLDFDLFTLNAQQFKLLYLCLQKDQILQDIPQKIKKDSSLQEEDITKKLYKDYSAFKNALFHDLVLNNPEMEKLTLFKKSQKLIDRFLFIFFAEDKGLLPPNSITKIVKHFEAFDELDDYRPLYDVFKQYFGYINAGRPAKNGRAEIFAYNGGLFAPDASLDSLKITDAILMNHSLLLSAYDFESEVDVNILGHIFEHSLNEIDEITAEIAGEKVDKSKTKRKKDGVFYTPKYITKYIVDNTVGKLCDTYKEEHKFDENEYRPNRTKPVKKRLLEELEAYRAYLLSLTICDPACGSGAFLNQALDFLIREHRDIDALQTRLLGGSIILSDITNDILERNIYGVDINEESVDIARLSLWLRTAQKGRTLTTLNGNIKCGNSLIDDIEVAGEKAFDWEKEFPEVFANGGFDVVIGNPPYGANISSLDDIYLRGNYEVASYQIDTYPLFCERGRIILKENGTLGYIIPSAWVTSVYDKELRRFLLEKTRMEGIVIADKSAFADATVETLILLFSKSESSKKIKIERWDLGTISYDINLDEISEKEDYKFSVYSNPVDLGIVRKMQSSKFVFNDFAEVVWGIKVYEKGKGDPPQISEDSKTKKFHSLVKTKETHFPLIGGREINRYSLNWLGGFIDYGMWIAAPRKPDWFITDKKRIVIREITSKGKIQATIIENNVVFSNSVDGMRVRNAEEYSTHFLLGLINSKLLSFYHTNSSPNSFKGTFPKVLIKDLREFPFPEKRNLPENASKIEDLVISLLSSNELVLNILQKFRRLLKRKFNIEKLSKNLQNWHTLSFTEFVKELKKKKVKLGLAEESEWEDYFETEKAKAMEIQAVIDKTDREIDRMVYDLYGLTAEEIEVVEGS